MCVCVSYILAWNDIKVGYKNKTNFVWYNVLQYHFIWGGGGSPVACELR